MKHLGYDHSSVHIGDKKLNVVAPHSNNRAVTELIN